MLDPRFKLEYFRHQKWSELNVKNYRAQVENVWNTEYNPKTSTSADPEITTRHLTHDELITNCSMEEMNVTQIVWGLSSPSETNSVFQEKEDELGVYLREKLASFDLKDVLTWWKVYESTRNFFITF